jgi:hypothetical protein
MAKKLTMEVVVQGAEKAINKIKSVGEVFKKKGFSAGIQQFGKAGMIFGSIAAGIFAIGMAARRAVGKIMLLTRELDRIAKSANRIGITAEAFQKLEFAAAISGSSFNEVERAFKRMQKALYDFRTNSQIAVRAFKQLGITVDDIKNKKPEDVFRLVAKRLSQIRDINVQKGLGQVIFGRAGTNIGPMIENIEKLDKLFERFQLSISEDTLRGAEGLVDELNILQRQIRATASETGLITWVKNITEGINEAILSVRKLGDTFKYIGSIIENSKTELGGYKILPFLGGDTKILALSLLNQLGKKTKDKNIKRMLDNVIQDPEDLLPGTKGPKSPTDALLKIGGAVTPLAMSGAANPIVSELQKQTVALAEIRKVIEGVQGGQPGPFADIPDPSSYLGTTQSLPEKLSRGLMRGLSR